jgi:hypothetical protein
MTSRILATAVAAAFLATAAVPTVAFAAAAKKSSAQQEKMKDCAAKWGEEKKAKKVSGQKAHRAFMSTCLKG